MSKPDHSIGSYVTGFILSLVSTVIPYYLVVNKSISGGTLLATILGFAAVQMLIQIFFFLHLGRGPKPLYNVAFFVATIGIILIVVGGSIFIMNHLHYNMTPIEASKQLAESEAIYQVSGKKTGACQVIGANHKVTIINSQVSPAHTQAKLCDTLTFITQDNVIRDIGFGPHPVHEEDGGVSELLVRKRQNKTITLNQLGTYPFHDHLEPTVNGDFTVTQ